MSEDLPPGYNEIVLDIENGGIGDYSNTYHTNAKLYTTVNLDSEPELESLGNEEADTALEGQQVDLLLSAPSENSQFSREFNNIFGKVHIEKDYNQRKKGLPFPFRIRHVALLTLLLQGHVANRKTAIVSGITGAEFIRIKRGKGKFKAVIDNTSVVRFKMKKLNKISLSVGQTEYVVKKTAHQEITIFRVQPVQVVSRIHIPIPDSGLHEPFDIYITFEEFISNTEKAFTLSVAVAYMMERNRNPIRDYNGDDETGRPLCAAFCCGVFFVIMVLVVWRIAERHYRINWL